MGTSRGTQCTDCWSSSKLLGPGVVEGLVGRLRAQQLHVDQLDGRVERDGCRRRRSGPWRAIAGSMVVMAFMC